MRWGHLCSQAPLSWDADPDASLTASSQTPCEGKETPSLHLRPPGLAFQVPEERVRPPLAAQPLGCPERKPFCFPSSWSCALPGAFTGETRDGGESHLPAPQVTGHNALEFTAVHGCGDSPVAAAV